MKFVGQQLWPFGALSVLLLSSCTGASNDAVAEEVRIEVGGSAETLEVLEDLAETYEDTAEGVEISFLPASQSSGGLQGVRDAVLEIGGVSSPPDANALEGLQYFDLVQTPLAFIAHGTVTGVEDVTTEQLQQIYDGTITNWQDLGGPDAEILLMDFNEEENEKRLLREQILGADLEITDKAVVFLDDDGLFETAVITPYSLAAIPLEEDLKEADVTILSLDGVTPTAENLQSGNYPLGMTLGLVIAETPTPEVQAFIDFILSDAGQKVLAESTELDNE